MTRHVCRSALAVAALAALATLVPAAQADAAALTGTFAGGRVVVVTPSGQARSATPNDRRRFRLRLPAGARGSTLHIVGANGRYGGPVVLARAGKRAKVAISGRGGKLGRLRMAAGYAKAARAVAPRLLARRRGLRVNRRGAPRGAGRLGLGVRRARAAQSDQGPVGAQPGEDTDADGLPGVFDVDDDGDATLDATDPDQTEPLPVKVFARLRLDFPRAGNAHLAGSLDADAILGSGQRTFMLQYSIWPSGPIEEMTAAEVDCVALSYCGSALIADEPGIAGAPADIPTEQPWSTYDRNANGLPDLYRQMTQYTMTVMPRTSRAAIAPGDVSTFHRTRQGVVETFSTALDSMFLSAPGLVSYDAGAGPVPFTYPQEEFGPGTHGNPIQLTGDTLRLVVHRPQREPIPGAEAEGLIDIGGLTWYAGASLPEEHASPPFACDPSDYSATSATLTPTAAGSDPLARTGLLDTAPDAPMASTEPLAFTLDLGACVRRGAPNRSTSMLAIGLAAADRRGAETTQAFYVRL